MHEINPGTIERDATSEDTESNGKVEDQCKEDLIGPLSERVSKLEQSKREYDGVLLETYKNREEQKINLRDKYSNRVYVLVRNWSIGLISVLSLNAFKILGFHLSDKVIISLIAGVTLHLIAVLIVIMKNLFPNGIKE
jgi:hypothetical protein